ncbi:MAG: IclR family transcriptional regulator [Opitutales bacterium]|nr:IclR family transcriptional regulator [Opitutales bacterium]MBT7865653.1 IclR family transcriptional regulator [Opitutales bacterium]
MTKTASTGKATAALKLDAHAAKGPKAGRKSGSGIQVIARAASILCSLENEKDGLSLGQIANRVDLPRSTIQRIVNALTEENLLIRATPNARVKLGPSILRLAANTDFDFAAHVRPHLETLAQRTGETVDLSIQRGDKMVFIDQITANHRLSAVSAVGKSFHMFSSAHGKAALALLEEDEIRRLLAGSLAKKTANTITNVSDLITQLAKTRKTQIAIDNEEHTQGICAIGTAFRDPLGRVFAVSVPVPTIRFVKSKKLIIQALTDLRENLLPSLAD